MNSGQESVDKAVDYLNNKEAKQPKLHSNTFEYLKPNDDQLADMGVIREATKAYADTLQRMLPDGPDKTYTLRKLREVGMWANIAVTRNPDGSPRT